MPGSSWPCRGCSEHETGLAIDLGQGGGAVDFIRPAFPETGACGAFRRLAARYGFVLRYPEGKERVTGIAHEPWHFRYVGVPHARLMEEAGLCLEEYFDFLRERPRRCVLENGLSVTARYVPWDGMARELELPEGCWQLSGDNASGFVLTVWNTRSSVGKLPFWIASAWRRRRWWCASTPLPWPASRPWGTSGSPGSSPV